MLSKSPRSETKSLRRRREKSKSSPMIGRPRHKLTPYLSVITTSDSSKFMRLWHVLPTINSSLPKKDCYSTKKEISSKGLKHNEEPRQLQMWGRAWPDIGVHLPPQGQAISNQIQRNLKPRRKPKKNKKKSLSWSPSISRNRNRTRVKLFRKIPWQYK